MDNVVRTTCVPVIETIRVQIVPNVSCLFCLISSLLIFSSILTRILFTTSLLPHIQTIGTCPFGRAHVDTPKGDLDSSLILGNSNDVVLSGSTGVYPYGTTEGFPLMADTAGNVYSDTAHEYMECSNKGLCDRDRGLCECLPGYDGAACQRASCPSNVQSLTPGSSLSDRSNLAFKIFNGKSAFSGRVTQGAQEGQCSGHGTCMTQAQLSSLDNNNIYDLWDKDSTMGCKCDPGCVSFVCVYVYPSSSCRLTFSPHHHLFTTQLHWT